MKKHDNITIHDRYAAEYDDSVRDYGSHAAEILFGLSYEYVEAGERLLDVGIGTGLSSLPFARAGLEIFGLDDSGNYSVTSRSDLPIFIHHDDYIESLIDDNGLTLLRKGKFLLWSGEGNVDDTFQAFVVRPMGENA